MYNPKVTVVLPIYKEFYLSSIQLCEKKNYSNEIKVRLIGPYLSFTIAALKQESIRNLSGTNKYGEYLFGRRRKNMWHYVSCC